MTEDQNINSKILATLIVGGVVTTAFIGFNRLSILKQNLSGDISIDNLKIEKITDSTATISWTTDYPNKGKLIYSKNGDICTQETNKVNCLTLSEENDTKEHIITIKNLLPQTTYYFAVETEKGLVKDEIGKYTSFETTLTDGAGILPNKETPNLALEDSESAVLGIKDVKEGVDTPTYSSGVESENDNKMVNQNKFDNFQEAIKKSNLSYDFNKDGIVDTKDYLKYLEFITNKED